MTNDRIIALAASIENFEYARERLLRKQKEADEVASAQLAQSLANNQEAISALRTKLGDEVERLNRSEGPRGERDRLGFAREAAQPR